MVLAKKAQVLNSPCSEMFMLQADKISSLTCRYLSTGYRVSEMSNPTVVITGIQDIFSPPAKSVTLAEKIPGTWLVQIEGGRDGLMFQYHNMFAKVLETFLAVI